MVLGGDHYFRCDISIASLVLVCYLFSLECVSGMGFVFSGSITMTRWIMVVFQVQSP